MVDAMEQPTTYPLTDAARQRYRRWWNALPERWQRAFHQAYWGRGEVCPTPTDEELHDLWHTEVLRLVGPRAPYPNMTFELPDLEGVCPLRHLKLLVATHHHLVNLEPLAEHTAMEALFLSDNKLEHLAGIEQMHGLKTLQVQQNAIGSLKPLEGLTQLHTVYALHNALTTLDGITEAHSDCLLAFHVLPNARLPQREVIRIEHQMGVRCLRG